MDTSTCARRGALVFLASCLGVPPIAAGEVGTTAGQFEVSAGGSATYSIPITVPPGTSGMAPKLTIEYDSQSANGTLGVGFSLSGLSSITRCSTSIEPEGYIDGPDFDNNDRFCLDGQRLMLYAGSYGAVGAEYRTEIEAFSKVVSNAGTAYDPGYFRVWTKSGLVMEFGGTSDSRWESAAAPTTSPAYGKAHTWAVNKIWDAAGNYLTVTYSEDAATGETAPLNIQYTGNSTTGLAPNASVTFVYDTNRPDKTVGYLAGAKVTQSKRLTKVATWVNGIAVREYRLSYDTGGHMQRSRLKSITECTGGGQCLPATTFTWNAPGTYAAQATEPGAPQHYVADGNMDAFRSLSRFQFGDFDGDGRADIYYIGGYGDSSATATIYLSRYNVAQSGGNSVTVNGITHFIGAGSETAVLNLDDRAAIDVLRIKIADLNADGFSDVFVIRGYGLDNIRASEIYLNNRAGGFFPWQPGPSLYVSGKTVTDTKRTLNRVRLIDMNGDGLTDIYVAEGDGSTANGRIYRNQASAPGTFVDLGSIGPPLYVSYDSGWASADVSRPKFGDFNGDGLTDIYVVMRVFGASTGYVTPANLYLQKQRRNVCGSDKRPRSLCK